MYYIDNHQCIKYFSSYSASSVRLEAATPIRHSQSQTGNEIFNKVPKKLIAEDE